MKKIKVHVFDLKKNRYFWCMEKECQRYSYKLDQLCFHNQKFLSKIRKQGIKKYSRDARDAFRLKKVT